MFFKKRSKECPTIIEEYICWIQYLKYVLEEQQGFQSFHNNNKEKTLEAQILLLG